jgi:hypothetical protein
MNSTDLFELLLDQRKIALETSKDHANILRVAIVRKFSDYKRQMTALGFLDEDLEKACVSLEYHKESGVATFYIRAKRESKVVFKLLIDGDTDASEVPANLGTD